MTKKLLKTCVFACFPAGNQVHTEQDFKNIEEIQAGDKVWAYNEETGEIALQEVLYTIETTALHPFYVNGQWKEASELEKGDKIIAQNKEEIVIKSVKFKYTSQKVYNFEVAHWHTYFVGIFALLVHNAQKCLSQMMLESQKWFQNIMRGKSFNNVMNAFTEELAKGKLFKSELYVTLKNGSKGYIDSFIKGLGIIERKATDLSKISVRTAKNYIDDAAKYTGSVSQDMGKLTEKVYLHVENMKGVSKEVLDHAAKKGVEIIDDISKIKGL